MLRFWTLAGPCPFYTAILSAPAQVYRIKSRQPGEESPCSVTTAVSRIPDAASHDAVSSMCPQTAKRQRAPVARGGLRDAGVESALSRVLRVVHGRLWPAAIYLSRRSLLSIRLPVLCNGVGRLPDLGRGCVRQGHPRVPGPVTGRSEQRLASVVGGGWIAPIVLSNWPNRNSYRRWYAWVSPNRGGSGCVASVKVGPNCAP